MKFFVFSLRFFAMALSLMFLSCDKGDEAVDCVKLVNRFDKALKEYSIDPMNRAKCNELKAAANDLAKNKDCQVPGVDYQQYVSALTCE